MSRRFNSLLFQLLAITVGTVSLIAVASSLYLYSNVSNSLDVVMERRAFELVDELGFAIEVLLRRDDLIAVQRLVERTATFEDVQDVVVVNRNGQVLAAKNFTTLTAKTYPSLAEYGLDWTDVTKIIASERIRAVRGASAYAVVAPLHGLQVNTQSDVSGAVIVQIRLGDVQTQLNHELAQRGWFNIATLAFVVLLIVPLVYLSVIRPVRQLTLATQTIAAGDLTTRVPMSGARELQQLTDSFNRMTRDLQQRIREQEILNEISSAISTTLDLDTLLRYAANHAARLVDGTGAFITLWDAEKQQTRPVAAYGSFHDLYTKIVIPPNEPTLTAHVIQAGKPIVVPDVSNTPYISPRIAAQFPDKSLLGVPLIVHGKPIGAVIIGELRYHREFTAHEIKITQSAANQLASAIANAQWHSELAAERQRLDEILTAVSDAIVFTDTRGIPLYVNPAFARMTGLTPRAFIGHPIPTWLFEGTTFGELGPNIAATIAKQQLWRGEFLMHRLDGATFNADIAVAPMRRGEQSIGYIASIRDVTEMKELERMKDRFVATVSHELRTPVSVIMLHLDNLLEFYTQLSAQQHQHMLGEIQRETDTLHHLIEDLLVLSRVDAGRAQPRYSDWDLRELLDETLQRAEIQAALKHVTLRLSDAPPHLRVRADRDQIAQVLRNLVNNAIKFNLPEGQVTISLEKRDEHIVINVADTGMGIPADDVPKLFQRFYRSRLSVQNEIQGTGLGLAIAAEIVQRHHGDIQVTSELNVGTTFRVTLPLQPPHAPLLNSGRWYV